MMKGISDKAHKELSSQEIFDAFSKEYINYFDPIDITDATFKKVSTYKSDDGMIVDMRVDIGGDIFEVTAEGNGRLNAINNALKKTPYHFDYTLISYTEHALETSSSSKAAAYICIEDSEGVQYWGVGTHDDIILASVNALVSALNRENRMHKFVK